MKYVGTAGVDSDCVQRAVNIDDLIVLGLLLPLEKISLLAHVTPSCVSFAYERLLKVYGHCRYLFVAAIKAGTFECESIASRNHDKILQYLLKKIRTSFVFTNGRRGLTSHVPSDMLLIG